MMVHDLRKKTTALLLCLLIGSSIFAAPTDAKPKNDPKPPVKHTKQVHHEKLKNCGDVVRDVLRADRHDFDRACHAGMTLEDYIVAKYIAESIGGDFTDIFRMQKNGKPYKEICKAHGINWGSVRRHLNDKYDRMNSDAVAAGLVMWGLHEILHW